MTSGLVGEMQHQLLPSVASWVTMATTLAAMIVSCVFDPNHYVFTLSLSPCFSLALLTFLSLLHPWTSLFPLSSSNHHSSLSSSLSLSLSPLPPSTLLLLLIYSSCSQLSWGSGYILPPPRTSFAPSYSVPMPRFSLDGTFMRKPLWSSPYLCGTWCSFVF